MKFSSKLRGAAVGVALAVGAGGADAAPTTALYLTMDGSGSINATDFATQVTAYTTALSAFFAANPGAFGTVAIGGNIFGRDVFEWGALTPIDDPADLTALNVLIAGLNPGRGGVDTTRTALGDAIDAATDALLAFDLAQGDTLRKLIDVTTDGAFNIGLDPATASGDAITAGVSAVNCLGFGAGDCSFVVGFGTDFGTVSIADLGTALARKIREEVVGVPEPMALALFGLGLAGLGLMRRRAD